MLAYVQIKLSHKKLSFNPLEKLWYVIFYIFTSLSPINITKMNDCGRLWMMVLSIKKWPGETYWVNHKKITLNVMWHSSVSVFSFPLYNNNALNKNLNEIISFTGYFFHIGCSRIFTEWLLRLAILKPWFSESLWLCLTKNT